MIYIETNSLDPTWNLACEEYALKCLSHLGPILMLWQNRNAVIIGRYQNMLKEVQMEAVKRHQVQVVRRSTGGGTVYHDLGNLNYSFIFKVNNPEEMILQNVSKPVIAALAQMGVRAEVNGRNDITIDGKKISGTAQCLHDGYLLHHGTLLFHSDIAFIDEVLSVDRRKLAAKGTDSVKSRVVNISSYLKEPYTISEFKEKLLEYLTEHHLTESYSLTDYDKEQIAKMQKEKYLSWQWNMGKTPPFNLDLSVKFDSGLLEIKLLVQKGIINECKITGDFLGLLAVEELEEKLKGLPYERKIVSDNLEESLELYLGRIKKAEFLDCLFLSEVERNVDDAV